MGISFKDTAGSAKKNNLNYFKFKDGINKFRMVGNVLPRYVYWAKSYDGQANLAIECLSFDRKEEKFTNVEKDWFSVEFPDVKCSWAYVIQAIDYSGDKPVLGVLALKKKLFGQIVDTAKKAEFGDPTDLETGWMCVVERKKTGLAAFNVEYNLDQFETLKEKRPLTDEERELLVDMKDIDELFPKQTSDEQKQFIQRVILTPPESAEDNTDEEAAAEADVPQ